MAGSALSMVPSSSASTSDSLPGSYAVITASGYLLRMARAMEPVMSPRPIKPNLWKVMLCIPSKLVVCGMQKTSQQMLGGFLAGAPGRI